VSNGSPIPQVDVQCALSALGLNGAELISGESRATDTLVWKVTYRGSLLAVRVFRPEQRSVTAREADAMRLAREHGIPVPAILVTSLVENRYPAMAIEWIEGETLADALLATPIRAHRLGLQAGLVLAQIHDIPVQLKTRSTEWIERGASNDPALMRKLHEMQTDAVSLLHLDYHPFNLITKEGKIRAVLDWTNTSYGDPRADIARTVSTMRLVAPHFIARFGAHRMTMSLFTRGFLKGYEEKRGPLTGMAPFYAWAGAMILEDLTPKLHALPIANPELLRNALSDWATRWRSRDIDD
jgi:aminoglycoside phosphotransferase (APT) family kinase protein